MDLPTFNTLVQLMQSADNEARTNAERSYEQIALPLRASMLFQLYDSKDAAFISNEVRLMITVNQKRWES